MAFFVLSLLGRERVERLTSGVWGDRRIRFIIADMKMRCCVRGIRMGGFRRRDEMESPYGILGIN